MQTPETSTDRVDMATGTLGSLVLNLGYLLLVHGWNAGSAAELRMPGKVFLTALAGTLGIVMILLKVLLSHLH